MPGYVPGCTNTQVPYNCDKCPDTEAARVRHVAFIKDTYIDTINIAPTDISRWTGGINSNFDVIIIPDVHGELAEPSEVVGQGYGDKVEELLSFDNVITYFDRRYKDNCEFYNLIKEGGNYYMAYFTETQGHITPDPVTIIPKPLIPDDIGANVEWKVLAKWRNKTHPCPFDADAALFTSCFIP